ncbi:outer membrane beta-barrel protein [Olleya sp. HaHaR_3_96]|uniref:outer membrane beta-barrel protein n=1 Tax=Olleya sp. HaHaR_3_96 TaxID=2745560 RepID=UPI001C4F7335|nr:outer membrane beta-barrel protein [Olleya sp. HaHaR_3_96]QXP59342.1 outer membrane beta-barrel protein [Olleya sp. HaHaR_3_96]
MKKQLGIFAILSLMVTSFYAQDDLSESEYYLLKDDILLEGVVSFKSQSDEEDLSGVKSSSYTINPKAGYFITDDLAIGLDLSYSFGKSETEEVSQSSNIEDKTIMGGVFLRYYFLNLGKRFKIYGELGGGYVTSETGFESDPEKSNGLQSNLTLGLNYFVKENIAISFVLADLVKYKSITYEERFNNEVSIRDEITVNTLTADLNVFNNFFGGARFGVMFKF